MIDLKILAIPIVGFIIGAFTNYLAIKMLFHPRKKIFGVQGLLPKRKELLAKRIGEASPEIMPSYFQKLEKIPVVGAKIISFFKKSVENQINSLSVEELEKIILRVMKKEMGFLVWIGGIIGFLIGLVQVLVFLI
ncbi:hypothetical protein CMI42_00710 [Candidatus Pacearchaeota archaeon]|nr:hypothetical protein [Candidatus Pacearchaeota archaeon]